MRRIASKLFTPLSSRGQRPVILMYHRVAFVQHDPWGLAVGPDRFDAQMDHLKKHRAPMSVTEMADRLSRDRLPKNAVAITFDDGYRDNLLNAKPILRKHGLPATLFLTAGAVDGDSQFWWDELATMILACEQPSQHVEVCGGEAVRLEWGGPEAFDRSGEWRAADGARTDRQHAFLWMSRALREAGGPERESVMLALRTHFKPRREPDALPMTSSDIRDLLSDGLFELGAHTLTHPALTLLTPAERRREIAESARACSAFAGKAIGGFAYPYGDLNAETRHDVIDAGFDWACSTRSAAIGDGHADLYALPRIAARDIAGRRFRDSLEP